MEKLDARGAKPEDPPREAPEVFCPIGMTPDMTMYCLRDSCGMWSKDYGKCSFTLEEELLRIIKAELNSK
jgi:hypothetical protein